MLVGLHESFSDFLFSLVSSIETDKEMYRRELLNQPMRVQVAGLRLHYQSKINAANKENSDWMGRIQ